jgi:hypothetical protein
VSDNQRKALDALEEADGALGYAEWRAISGIPKGSFGRVVRTLVESGLVLKGATGYRLASDHRHTDTSPTDTAPATDPSGTKSPIDKPHSPDTSRAVKTGMRAYSAATGGMVDVWWVDGRLRKGDL